MWLPALFCVHFILCILSQESTNSEQHKHHSIVFCEVKQHEWTVRKKLYSLLYNVLCVAAMGMVSNLKLYEQKVERGEVCMLHTLEKFSF